MKNLFVGLIVFAVFISCDKDSIGDGSLKLDTETEFKSGNVLSNDLMTIYLDSVISDSRCPMDVYCIWEGNAAVNFVVTIDATEHLITLNTSGGANFPSDTILNEYSIALTNLLPYPESTGTIAQDEYEASVIVKALED